jgi:hypothetical protein
MIDLVCHSGRSEESIGMFVALSEGVAPPLDSSLRSE